MIFLGINFLHVDGNGEGLGIYSGTRARGQCLVLRVEKWQLVNEDRASQSKIRPSEFIGGQLFFKNNARKKINIGNQSKPDNQQENKKTCSLHGFQPFGRSSTPATRISLSSSRKKLAASACGGSMQANDRNYSAWRCCFLLGGKINGNKRCKWI